RARRHGPQDRLGDRREVHEHHVGACDRFGGLGLAAALVHGELGGELAGERRFVLGGTERVIGDNDFRHATASVSVVARSRPRVARLLISARMPKVQSGACSAEFTTFTRLPSRGEDMSTMSPRLWVKPLPGSSRSSVGTNIVPVNSTKPSGYWWCDPYACSMSSLMSRLISLTGLTPLEWNPSCPVISSFTSTFFASENVNCSSNKRRNGPMAHEALLSLASVSSSALRPSKSRRLTSLPRVAATGTPREFTATTSSGSGLFQVDRSSTPISAPVPTADNTGALVKISGSGPMPTSRYCDHRPSSTRTCLTCSASAEPGFTWLMWPAMTSARRARSASALAESPLARSSMTRSSMLRTNVTPAALSTWRSTGARKWGRERSAV